MRLSTISCGLLACITPLVSATALTYKLAAHEKACFYAAVEEVNAKVAFYFAVRPASPYPIPCTIYFESMLIMMRDV